MSSHPPLEAMLPAVASHQPLPAVASHQPLPAGLSSGVCVLDFDALIDDAPHGILFPSSAAADPASASSSSSPLLSPTAQTGSAAAASAPLAAQQPGAGNGGFFRAGAAGAAAKHTGVSASVFVASTKSPLSVVFDPVANYLGEDSFATVFKARLMPSSALALGAAAAGHTVKVKLLRTAGGKALTPVTSEGLRKVCQQLRSLSFHRLVPYLGLGLPAAGAGKTPAASGGAVRAVVQEWVDGISLHDLILWLNPDCVNLHPNSGERDSVVAAPDRLPLYMRLSIARDVCEGLCYLHDLLVPHGQLSSRNVLISPDGHARLTDFGLCTASSTISSHALASVLPLETAWTAPELLTARGHPHASVLRRADCYSLGIVLFQIFGIAFPVPPQWSIGQIMQAVAFERPAYRPPLAALSKHVPAGLEVLMEGLWEADAAKRPTAREALMQMPTAMKCQVCFMNLAGMCQPCRHATVCQSCTQKVHDQGTKAASQCPLCKCTVDTVLSGLFFTPSVPPDTPIHEGAWVMSRATQLVTQAMNAQAGRGLSLVSASEVGMGGGMESPGMGGEMMEESEAPPSQQQPPHREVGRSRETMATARECGPLSPTEDVSDAGTLRSVRMIAGPASGAARGFARDASTIASHRDHASTLASHRDHASTLASHRDASTLAPQRGPSALLARQNSTGTVRRNSAAEPHSEAAAAAAAGRPHMVRRTSELDSRAIIAARQKQAVIAAPAPRVTMDVNRRYGAGSGATAS